MTMNIFTNGTPADADEVNTNFEESVKGGYGMTAIGSDTAENNSVYLDSVDDQIKIKDNTGLITPVGSNLKLLTTIEMDGTTIDEVDYTLTAASNHIMIKLTVSRPVGDSNYEPLYMRYNNYTDNYYDYLQYNPDNTPATEMVTSTTWILQDDLSRDGNFSGVMYLDNFAGYYQSRDRVTLSCNVASTQMNGEPTIMRGSYHGISSAQSTGIESIQIWCTNGIRGIVQIYEVL